MIKRNFKASLLWANRAKLFVLNLVIFLGLGSTSITAQTTLNPGDICFAGYYRISVTNAGFSFVTLSRITRGTVVYFTDMGVDGTTGWGAGTEGYLKWTVGNSTGQDLLPGAIVSVVSPQTTGGMIVNMRTAANVTSVITSEFTASVAPSNAFSMSAGGDPILVFQTKSASKTFGQIDDTNLPLTDINFITGITTDFNNTTINPTTRWNLGIQDGRATGITSAQESTVPPGLTNGVNCISLGASGTNENYARYTGSLSGSRTQIMNQINTATGWDATNATTAVINLGSFSSNVALPVVFNAIKAIQKNDQLLVNWSTVSEHNNDYFEIQGSLDGVDFVKLGTVESKSNNGNSSQNIDYQFSIDRTGSLVLSGFGILTILGGAVFFSLRSRRTMIPLGICFMFFLSLTISSCSKKSTELNGNSDQSVFIRIAQVDKDGTISFSKVVTVHIQ